jgi:hypothetical protein
MYHKMSIGFIEYSDPNWVVNTNHTYKVWEIQIFDDS